MKVSTRALYGIQAMFDLGLQHRMGPVSVQSISERQHISISYLEQLFNKLRKDGWIESVRGPGGGYRLTKQPRLIRIGDIIQSLEGPLKLGGKVHQKKEEPVTQVGLILQKMWSKIDEGVSQVVNSLTLEDLCEQARQLRNGKELDHKHMFYI
jgi:Rrf2 family transcriptional regulator, cysteine metabolism repressor